jgi:hypothetical protein
LSLACGIELRQVNGPSNPQQFLRRQEKRAARARAARVRTITLEVPVTVHEASANA